MFSAGPFSDVTVLDLSRVLAGPYCTLVLADLGARVLKVERPAGGDDARGFGPFVAGRSAYFMSINRGKQSIALDLEQADDRAIFDALLEGADVLVENFRPGAMERLGYGWDTLHARHPRLIYAATSGFGQSGPYRERPAYDMVVQAMGGIMSLTGEPGGPPTRVGTSIGDIAAGLFTAVGVGAALYERQRTGEGQRIDVAMLDCQLAILENAIARYRASGQVPGPLGSRHPSISPFGAFEARDGPIVIAAGNDALFAALCRCLDLDDLPASTEFADNESRTRNVSELKRRLEAALARQSREHWLARLEAAGVPCSPINDVAGVLADPQVRARNMVIHADDPVAGRIEMAGNPIKLSASPDPASRRAAPELDADRESVLAELASRRGPDGEL